MDENTTYQAHALISLRKQDTGLLDWLNATLKNGLTRRLVIASPFAVAFVLNLLSLATYRLH